MMKEVMLVENVYMIGKVDDREVPFHRLMLEKGTTYNSYLLKTEKPTVIDTVDIEFGREYVEKLSEMIDPLDIQYIVINHTEPDHSGGLGALALKATNATIVCTKFAVMDLQEMYRLHERNFLVVKDGDTLDIGGKVLKFKETPYLHTKETMITYCIEDKILFPCDMFSTHVATYEHFNDLSEEDILEDFIGYYRAIMHPHRRYIKGLIEATEELDVKTIAPSHGFILRRDVQKYIDLYASMSKNTIAKKKATIVYTTLKNNTKKMATLMKEILEENGINVEIFNADKSEKQEIFMSMQSSDAIFMGTSTKYADMIGNLEEILVSMKSMDLSKKLGIAFGSYGWSGEAIEVIQDYLLEMNIDVQSTSKVIKTTGMVHVQFPIRIRFSPKRLENENIIKDSVTFVADLLLNDLK